MILAQRLILTLVALICTAQVQADTGVICGAASYDLARNMRELASLTSNPKYFPSTSRAPAASSSSVDGIDDNGSAAGTQQGMGAIFDWFDKNATKSRGLCTLGVRKAMQAGGWWPCGVGLGLSPQTDAGPNLAAHGFKKIQLSDPSKAKPGTVLIYKSVCSASVDKNARYGHIEMRTNKGYASDFFKSVPISTYNKCRKFKEAYVKVGPPGKACYQTMGRR